MDATCDELLCQLVSLDVEPPGLVAVVGCGSAPSAVEPGYSLLDVLEPLDLSDLAEVLVEVVAESSASHDLGTELGTVLDADDVLCAADPLLESLFHHETIDHIAHAYQLVRSSVSLADCHRLLPLLLVLESVLEVLILVLQVLRHHGESAHVPLVAVLLPAVECLGQRLLVKIDKPQLQALHVVGVVLAALLPEHEGTIHQVLMPLNEVPEELGLVLLG